MIKKIRRRCGASLLLLAFGLHLQSASADGVTVHVSTAQQLVSAVLTATKSKTPTAIELAAGHYVFTQTFNGNLGASALPMVNSRISIVGVDASNTILDASQIIGRILTVLADGNVTLRNLTLTGGAAWCETGGDCPTFGGGGVIVYRGTATVYDCIVSDNNALDPTGQSFSYGGGLLNNGGILNVESSTLSGNGAEGSGGGIASIGGSTSVTGSVITGGTLGINFGGGGTYEGGGVYVQGGVTTIIGSTITANNIGVPAIQGYEAVFNGGGIAVEGGTVDVLDSAITDNVIMNFGEGGAIYNNGTVKVQDSTFAGNNVPTSGGAIYNARTLYVQDSTFTQNVANNSTAIALPNVGLYFSFPTGCTLGVAGSCNTGGGAIWTTTSAMTDIATSALSGNSSDDCGGTMIDEGHNLLSMGADCTLTPSAALKGHHSGDLIGLDAMLGSLTDNGEPGNAHYPPLAGSPLIDAGGAVGKYCTATDQIGNKRVLAAGDHDASNICDIGAIEYQP